MEQEIKINIGHWFSRCFVHFCYVFVQSLMTKLANDVTRIKLIPLKDSNASAETDHSTVST